MLNSFLLLQVTRNFSRTNTNHSSFVSLFLLWFLQFHAIFQFLHFLVPSFLRFIVPSFFRSFVLSFFRSFVPSCLRAFVPSCLRAFVPSCLRSFVPSCLRVFVLFSLFSLVPLCFLPSFVLYVPCH